MLYHTYQANYLNADFAILQTGAYIIYIAKTLGFFGWVGGWGGCWQWVKIFIDITYTCIIFYECCFLLFFKYRER